MKYDNEYLKTLYDKNDLETFLSLVDVENIADSRKRAIIGALKRSIRVLNLDFNPLPIAQSPMKVKIQG
jgi:hypothetical protein